MSRPRKALGDHESSYWFAKTEKVWRAKVVVGRRPDGTPVTKRPKRKTRSAIREAVREIERARDAGTKVWTAKDPTVDEWTTRWLDVLLPLKQVKPKTINDYRSKLKCHVLPVLGSLRLSELTVECFQDIYAAMSAAGDSQHVIHGTHAVVRSCLNVAVRQRVLGINPVLSVEVARPFEDEVEPFTPSAARSILAAAETLGRNRPRGPVAIALGLRQGESLGLAWPNIDFEAGVLRVRRQLQREPGVHGCGEASDSVTGRWPCGYRQGARCPERRSGGLQLRDTKTRDSRRTVPIPAPLLEILRVHQAEQSQERLRAGDLWEDNDLVFCDEWGRPIDPRQDWATWKELLRIAQVEEKRLHDARHTAATMLLVMGVDSRTVMAIMGWTEQKTAKRYTHVVDELLKDAARKMQQAYWADEA